MTCNLNIVPAGWRFCPKIEAVKTTRQTLMPKHAPSVSPSLKRVTSSPSEPPNCWEEWTITTWRCLSAPLWGWKLIDSQKASWKSSNICCFVKEFPQSQFSSLWVGSLLLPEPLVGDWRNFGSHGSCTTSSEMARVWNELPARTQQVHPSQLYQDLEQRNVTHN